MYYIYIECGILVTGGNEASILSLNAHSGEMWSRAIMLMVFNADGSVSYNMCDCVNNCFR